MVQKNDKIHIGTISGGVLNFGSSVFNSPITILKSITNAGEGNTGTAIITNSGWKK